MYLYTLAVFLIIVGAIMKITHFWGGVGTIFFLLGFTLGAIATILDASGKPQKPLSRTAKILMYISAFLLIIGAILKIAHIWDVVNFLMIWSGYALGSIVFFMDGRRDTSQS